MTNTNDIVGLQDVINWLNDNEDFDLAAEVQKAADLIETLQVEDEVSYGLIKHHEADITAMGEDMAKETQLVNAYAKTIVELKGLVYEHLTAPDTQKIREWEDLARRSRAALEGQDET